MEMFHNTGLIVLIQCNERLIVVGDHALNSRHVGLQL